MEDQQITTQRQRSRASEIIVTGNIWRAVWYVAWPTALNTLFMTAYHIINRYFLGQLREGAAPALAASGIGGAALMVQFAVMFGLSIGTSALVARFLGAMQMEDADEATRQSIILSVAAGVLTAIPLITLAPQIVRLIGAQENVVPLAAEYTAIIAYFSVPMFLYFTITSVLRSAGDVRSPLYAGAVVTVVNVVLDWLLILGPGGLPMLGIRGAAIATGLSRIVAIILLFWFLKRSVLSGSLAHMRPHRGWLGRIMHIGWPATLQNLVWTTAFTGFLMILGVLEEATAAQAALTVAIAIESLAFMPGVAYSTAATPLVGQNLGAGQPHRAEHSAWVATGQAAAIMSIVALGFFIFPRWLALKFTDDTAVVPLIVSYLRINAISEPFLAVNMVLRGALQGAGDVRVPTWITVFTSWVIRLPLTYLLAVTFAYGATGAWIAMSASTILSGILILIWFKWGTWRTTEV